MAMLHWFINNRPIDSFMVVNIDHGIRGEESTQECRFVADYALKNKVEYKLYKLDCLKHAKECGYTLEQAARILRHDIFSQVCCEYADVVATAHHSSDQAESIFMHIARGCGIDGLSGMSVVDGHLIRPLLHTSKKQIQEYITTNAIEYRTDSSNTDEVYSRNYVRRVIFPTIEEKYPTFEKSLIRLASRADEIADYIDSNIPTLSVSGGAVRLDIAGKHRVIAAEMFRRACVLLGVEADVEERHVELALNARGRVDLPYGLVLYPEQGDIVVEQNRKLEFTETEFCEGEFPFGRGLVSIRRVDKADFSDGALYIDADKVKSGTLIRRRREGDRIEKFGGGSKSLGDYLTDKKVPIRLRDTIAVIAHESEVYAAIPIDISAKVKIEPDTTRIYRITYEEL